LGGVANVRIDHCVSRGVDIGNRTNFTRT
jgi:hypothetical protein